MIDDLMKIFSVLFRGFAVIFSFIIKIIDKYLKGLSKCFKGYEIKSKNKIVIKEEII